MFPFDDEGVDNPHHQRGVAAGNAGEPLGLRLVRQVGPQRTDQHEIAAALCRPPHSAALDMLADATAGDHRVLRGHATESEHDLAVLRDLLPGDVALGQALVIADYVWDQHLR